MHRIALETLFAGNRHKVGVVMLALIAVTACGADEGPSGSVTLSGDPHSVVAAADVRDEENAPEGLILAKMHLALDGEGLRARFTPRDDLSQALASEQLPRPPVWSLSLWNGGEASEVPAYWIAATWPAAAESTASLPIQLDVWVCPRAAFPEGAEHEMRSRRLGDDTGAPSAVCGRRSSAARATASRGHVELEVPISELDGLQSPLLWTAVATASRSRGTVGWSHCVPACPQSDWSFPPAEARATLPQD